MQETPEGQPNDIVSDEKADAPIKPEHQENVHQEHQHLEKEHQKDEHQTERQAKEQQSHKAQESIHKEHVHGHPAINIKGIKDKKDHEHEHHNEHHANRKNLFHRIYDDHYKALLIFSVLLLIFSVGTITYKYVTTGDFVSKGVSLKGGLTLTVNTQEKVDSDMLNAYLIQTFPKSDINVQNFNVGAVNGFVVEASDVSETDLVNAIKVKVPNISPKDYSSELVGPSLGSSFFVQTLKAIFIAFLFMSLVVYLYFGSSMKLKWLTSGLSVIAALMMFYADSIIFYITPLIILAILVVIYFRDNIPSFGIMLCAFSDVFFSLAIFNLVNLKLNTAGVAAFLMLVGYSIDTDILLAVRVLKRKEGTILDRTVGAMKTGMMMSISALAAVLAAYFFTHSAVIKEIMFILIIGLIGDIIFTWIQNAGILRWHLEKRGWK